MSCFLDETGTLKRLRSFQKSCVENRRCANCREIGPNYVCVDFGTFVCSICSGIHREFNHKVKGISLSKWTPDQVQFICNHGNQKDALIFLGNRNPSSPSPGCNNTNHRTSNTHHLILKEFIKHKYIDRIWVNQPLYDLYFSPTPNHETMSSKPRLTTTTTTTTDSNKSSQHRIRKNHNSRNPFFFIN